MIELYSIDEFRVLNIKKLHEIVHVFIKVQAEQTYQISICAGSTEAYIFRLHILNTCHDHK